MQSFPFVFKLWIPCLAIAAIFHARAVYLKRVLVRKYKFTFPSVLGIVSINELKSNYESTDSHPLKEVLSKLIFAKKWTYISIAAAIGAFAAPFILQRVLF